MLPFCAIGIEYDDRHTCDMGVWRLYTAWRNRKPGFNPAVGLNMNLRSSVILATFCVGITAYAGTIQQQSDAPPVQNVAHQDALEDRVSTAPDRLLKRFSDALNVKLSPHLVTPAEGGYPNERSRATDTFSA